MLRLAVNIINGGCWSYSAADLNYQALGGGGLFESPELPLATGLLLIDYPWKLNHTQIHD